MTHPQFLSILTLSAFCIWVNKLVYIIIDCVFSSDEAVDFAHAIIVFAILRLWDVVVLWGAVVL